MFQSFSCRTSRLGVIAAVLCALSIATGSVSADDRTEMDGILVSVFACYVEIPSRYVLNTHDTKSFSFFQRSPLAVSRIVIGALGSEGLDESFDVVKSEKSDGLTLERLSRHEGTGDDRVDTATRLHDGKQQIVVYGIDDSVVESMVIDCRERPRRDLN